MKGRFLGDQGLENERDFISLNRALTFPDRRTKTAFLPWRIVAAALFLGMACLVLHGWVPVPERFRQMAINYLTSPAEDWTPRLVNYFSLDSFERHGYYLVTPEESPAGESVPAATSVTPAVAVPDNFVVPVPGQVIGAFGERASIIDGQRFFHDGVDLAATSGQTVKASLSGRVVTTRKDGDTYTVRMDHGDGLMTTYSRLAVLKVSAGELVAAGQDLGSAAGGWLHFAVERNGSPMDPMEWI